MLDESPKYRTVVYECHESVDSCFNCGRNCRYDYAHKCGIVKEQITACFECADICGLCAGVKNPDPEICADADGNVCTMLRADGKPYLVWKYGIEGI